MGIAVLPTHFFFYPTEKFFNGGQGRDELKNDLQLPDTVSRALTWLC